MVPRKALERICARHCSKGIGTGERRRRVEQGRKGKKAKGASARQCGGLAVVWRYNSKACAGRSRSRVERTNAHVLVSWLILKTIRRTYSIADNSKSCLRMNIFTGS